MPFNLVILLVGIYLNSIIRQVYKDACTGVCIAWKEQMSSTNDWLKKCAESHSASNGQVRNRFVFRWVPCKLKYLILLVLCFILKFSLTIVSLPTPEGISEQKYYQNFVLFCFYTTRLLKWSSNRKTSYYNGKNFPLSFISVLYL